MKIDVFFNNTLGEIIWWLGFVEFLGWSLVIIINRYPICKSINFLLIGLCMMLLSKWFKLNVEKDNGHN